MYNNPFRNTESPINERDIEEVEAELGFRFPPDIKRHYLVYNGGRPVSRRCFPKDGESYVLHNIMPLRHDSARCLLSHFFISLKREQKVLPEHLVPFAYDEGGDIYCFSTRSTDLGAIYLYSHEFCDEPERNIEYVAPSIREFIEGMVTDEEADRIEAEYEARTASGR